MCSGYHWPKERDPSARGLTPRLPNRLPDRCDLGRELDGLVQAGAESEAHRRRPVRHAQRSSGSGRLRTGSRSTVRSTTTPSAHARSDRSRSGEIRRRACPRRWTRASSRTASRAAKRVEERVERPGETTCQTRAQAKLPNRERRLGTIARCRSRSGRRRPRRERRDGVRGPERRDGSQAEAESAGAARRLFVARRQDRGRASRPTCLGWAPNRYGTSTTAGCSSASCDPR